MDFKKQIIENMHIENKILCEVPEREELLMYLNNMMLFTGRVDIMYCNSFLSEAVQLLKNSIFLYEDGYFDCAFYSVRQACEVFDSMLYLSNSDKEELKKWNFKERFPLDAKVRKKLENMANGYTEIKTILSDYFIYHRELIDKSHKIIHKQGFDTFYTSRKHNKDLHKKDMQLFVETLKYSIGIGIILFFILEPLALALTDAEIDSKLNFEFMTEPMDCYYFEKYLGLKDIEERLLKSNYYIEFVEQFRDRESMNIATYSVVRDNAWDVNSLDDIERQLHLLNTYEQYMFSILKLGICISDFYYLDGWGWYFTTYEIENSENIFGSDTFKKYLDRDERFNQQCENAYISVINMYDQKLLMKHKEVLLESEINLLVQLEKQSMEAYKEICEYMKVLEQMTIKTI